MGCWLRPSFFAFFHFLNKDPFCLNTTRLLLLLFYFIYWWNLSYYQHTTLFQSVLPARLSWFPRALPVWRNPTSEIQGTLLKNKPHDQGCDSWAVGDSAETSVDPESKVRARINGESCQLPGGLWIRARWSFFSPVGLKPKGQRCDKHRWVAAAQIAGGLTGLATSALFRQ